MIYSGSVTVLAVQVRTIKNVFLSVTALFRPLTPFLESCIASLFVYLYGDICFEMNVELYFAFSKLFSILRLFGFEP